MFIAASCSIEHSANWSGGFIWKEFRSWKFTSWRWWSVVKDSFNWGSIFSLSDLGVLYSVSICFHCLRQYPHIYQYLYGAYSNWIDWQDICLDYILISPFTNTAFWKIYWRWSLQDNYRLILKNRSKARGSFAVHSQAMEFRVKLPNGRPDRVLTDFDPTSLGLAADFRLTSFAAMKGWGCKVNLRDSCSFQDILRTVFVNHRANIRKSIHTFAKCICYSIFNPHFRFRCLSESWIAFSNRSRHRLWRSTRQPALLEALLVSPVVLNVVWIAEGILN